MKLTPAHAAQVVKVCLILGVLSLVGWVALVFVPGSQGEFFFFYIGFQFTVFIPVLYYRLLHFEDNPKTAEGRYD